MKCNYVSMKSRLWIYCILFLSILVFSCKENNDRQAIEKTEDTENAIDFGEEETNEKLVVIAKQGLVIRDEPGLTGYKIGKFEYLSEVEVIEVTDQVLELKDENTVIKGNWVKVVFEAYKSAYVFDGFLKTKDELKASNASYQFKVANVKMATNLLSTVNCKVAVQKAIGKEVYFLPEESEKKELVYSGNNIFLETVQLAYDSHRPLVLSPDIIWLAIAQGFSCHVNENFKTLEDKIFVTDKPDKIKCREDSLSKGAKHWGKLVSSLSNETKKYTQKNLYKAMVPNFSTTTSLETTSFEVTLLESFEQAFEYVGETGCGIPYITIEGIPEDWGKIYANIDNLKGYGLDDWIDQLKPVLQEFENASKGEINTVFWKDIYKNASEYGAFYISGWIVKFFPYIKTLESDVTGSYDPETGMTKVKEVYIKNPFYKDNDYLMSTLSTDDFPSGFSQIDILWNDYFNDKTIDIEVYAGFLGISQSSDISLKPYITYAICKKDASIIETETVYNSGGTSHDSYEYWIPYPVENKLIKQLSVYDIKKHKTNDIAIAYIKESIRSKFDVDGVKIDFVVLTNGTVTDIKIENSKDEQLLSDIRKYLYDLPQKWFPALAPIGIIDNDWDLETDTKKLMKVNSKIILEF
ncbi:DUF4419 domain-containing protein [Aquimarina algiphila]|uniref:DUF4419 domain-containing protein n=2 Tax=Aquimarina algiphila TaxID=2047982 RepID=A0A554VBX2_9FLAO|nr:DUF4419 domain-containing protein [Aquimarina algiphila]